MAPTSKYQLTIDSANVRYTEDFIESDYVYESVKCVKDEDTKTITVSTCFVGEKASPAHISLSRRVPLRLA